MFFGSRWKWRRSLYCFLCLFSIGNPQTATGQETTFELPLSLLKEHQRHILELSSDQQALAFHQKITTNSHPQHATLRHSSKNRNASSPPSPEMESAIATFWCAMAVLANIQKARAIPETDLRRYFASENLPLDTQREWISSKPSWENFKHIMEFQLELKASIPQQSGTLPLDDEYAHFMIFHDQAFSTPDQPSWITILKENGLKGIETILHEYWVQGSPHTPSPIPESQKQAYIRQYITSRLLPIFFSYILVQILEIEAQAYEFAWQGWHRLQQRYQEEQARRRLCGNWKWMIHNHQNHGDHKTTMTFTLPGKSTTSQVQPTTILIHGESVYLKWNFLKGIQEDSLLLSNHDTRLEGTFTNSLGPYGSISAQRLSSCEN